MLSEFFIEDFLITPPPPQQSAREYSDVILASHDTDYRHFLIYRSANQFFIYIVERPMTRFSRNDELSIEKERKRRERRGGNSCPRLAWCHACKVAITRWINVWGFVCVCVRASEAWRLARGANEYSRSVFERKTNTILRLHRVPFYGSRGAALINDPGHVVAASRTGGCRPFPILPRATTLPRLSLRSRNYARLESRRAQWPRCTFPIVYTITTTRWWLYRW